MKKVISLFLALTFVFTLAACSNNQPQTNDSSESLSEPTTESAETPADISASESSESENGKTLVVYFSATGNTEAAATYIAQETGGDLFELEPAEPYTDEDLNYSNEDSRVSREHEDESLRDVELAADTVENWDEYDTVFIGYPIWWDIAAWPVNDFVKSNDFTGKTVIPFATSANDDIGESGKLLEEMAGTGNWLEGKRLDRGISEDEVKDWISDLGISSVEN